MLVSAAFENRGASVSREHCSSKRGCAGDPKQRGLLRRQEVCRPERAQFFQLGRSGIGTRGGAGAFRHTGLARTEITETNSGRLCDGDLTAASHCAPIVSVVRSVQSRIIYRLSIRRVASYACGLFCCFQVGQLYAKRLLGMG
jgi:hypothetical protein